MKLITQFELAALNRSELFGLHREVFNELAASGYGSAERRNALASLENIERAIATLDL